MNDDRQHEPGTEDEDRRIRKAFAAKRVLGLHPAVVMIGLPVLFFALGFYLYLTDNGDGVSAFSFGLVLSGVGAFIAALLLGLSPPAGGSRYQRPRD